MVLRLRTFSTNLIRRWTTGKRGKRWNKVHGDCHQIWSPAFQTTLFPRFPPFPLSPHFLFLFFFSLCLLQALLKGNAQNNFLLIFNCVGFLILFRQPDWFCNLTFRAGAFFRPAVHQWKIGRKMLLKESPLETLLQLFGGCWPWYSNSPQNCLLRCCILRS